MNSKYFKSGLITTTSISFICIVLLNVCTFAIPFTKVDSAVFFVAYGCAEFLILLEMVLFITLLFAEDKANQRILGLPVVYSGLVTTIIQIFLTAAIYVANAFIALPLWVVIVIECILIGIGIIQIAKGLFFKARTEEYHEREANTKFMDEFRARLKALEKLNNNENVSKDLSNLVDIALGSDQITNDKTLDSEGELLSLLQELDVAIKDGLEDKTFDTIKLMKNVLLERNTLCKAGK